MLYVLSNCEISELGISGKCARCGKTQNIIIRNFNKRLERWKKGELIQNVFIELTPDEREFCISGICNECFDKMFRG